MSDFDDLHRRPPIESYQDPAPVPQPTDADFFQPRDQVTIGNAKADPADFRLAGDVPERLYWPNIDLPDPNSPNKSADRTNNGSQPEDREAVMPPRSKTLREQLAAFVVGHAVIPREYGQGNNALSRAERAVPYVLRRRGGDVGLNPHAPRNMHNTLKGSRDKAAKIDQRLAKVEEEKRSIMVRSDGASYDSGGKWGAHVLPLARLDYISDLEKNPTEQGFYIDPVRGKIPITLSRVDDWVDPLLKGRAILERRQEITEAYAAQQPYIEPKIEAWLNANPGHNVRPLHPIDCTGGGISEDELLKLMEDQLEVVQEKLGIDFDEPPKALKRIRDNQYYTPAQRKAEAKLLSDWIALNMKAWKLKAMQLDMAGLGDINSQDRSHQDDSRAA